MNSEELELSLRTEFESYLKNALADARQELSGLQEKIEAEFDKHRSQLDAVFQEFAARVDANKGLDPAFSESVVEHMRLARDEGARITATAIAEAESMKEEEEAQPAPANYAGIRDAISDISSKTSQSAILKALIHHAAEYTPRGAFFIIKNEHFVGWRVFGKEGQTDEQVVREVFFPISDDTVLGQSVRSLATAEGAFGTYNDDSDFLSKLDFGQPDKMYSIPLVARGRGVAVLYADYGNEGVNVNVEALETLVSIAGLTVELLAASQTAKAQPAAGAHDLNEEEFAGSREVEAPVETEAPAYTESHGFAYTEPKAEEAVEESGFAYTEPAAAEDTRFAYSEPKADETEAEGTGFAYTEPKAEETETESGFAFTAPAPEEEAVTDNGFAYTEPAPAYESEEETAPAAGFESEPVEEPAAPAGQDEVYSWNEPVHHDVQNLEPVGEETPAFDPGAQEEAPAYASTPSAGEYEFETNGSAYEPVAEEPAKPAWEAESFEAPKYEEPAPAAESKFDGFESNTVQEVYTPQAAPEPIVETVSAQPVKTRFSDRNVDLPIEVAEDERRLHNDARRFARLLVSEVKLYNEQKVKEGREGRDLYERLREAIDRSREMYDKRVQPPVASKFDYFHYELVSTLAEGDESKLGDSYPGATV